MESRNNVEKHTLEFTGGEIYTPPKVEMSPVIPIDIDISKDTWVKLSQKD
jgi:hypothetical protein